MHGTVPLKNDATAANHEPLTFTGSRRIPEIDGTQSLNAWRAGGYTTGRADVVSVLRQRARPYLFSNTLAPAVVGASLEAFDMLAGSSELRNTLQANTRFFRDAMQQVT